MFRQLAAANRQQAAIVQNAVPGLSQQLLAKANAEEAQAGKLERLALEAEAALASARAKALAEEAAKEDAAKEAAKADARAKLAAAGYNPQTGRSQKPLPNAVALTRAAGYPDPPWYRPGSDAAAPPAPPVPAPQQRPVPQQRPAPARRTPPIDLPAGGRDELAYEPIAPRGAPVRDDDGGLPPDLANKILVALSTGRSQQQQQQQQEVSISTGTLLAIGAASLVGLGLFYAVMSRGRS